ncbi:MAG: hypothetical protein DPW16_11155 [Chloroflexi bacterium]|nr:hypothetical protein [Chloroflexota bacterium]
MTPRKCQLIFILILLSFILAGCVSNSTFESEISQPFWGLTLLFSVILLSLISFIIPIENLIIVAVAVGLFATSNLFNEEVLFYVRFVPTGILTIRVFLYIATHQANSVYLPTLLLQPFGLLCVLASVSTVYSTSPFITLQRAISMGFSLIAFGIALPIYMIHMPQRIVNLLFGIELIVGGLILAGFSGLAVDPAAVKVGTLDRFSGLFSNPNGLGLIAMLIFFVSIAIWSVQKGVSRGLSLTIAFISIIAIFLSGSRGSFLGFIIGLITLLLIGNRGENRNTGITLITFILFIAFVSLALLPADVFARYGSLDDSGRLEIWENHLLYGKQAPILGLGFNASPEAYNHFLLSKGRPITLSSHNSYLQLFIGVGLIGVIIALWGFLRIILRGVQFIRSSNSNLFFNGFYAALIAGLTNAVLEGWLFSFGNGPTALFWLILSVLCLYIQHPQLFLPLEYVNRQRNIA